MRRAIRITARFVLAAALAALLVPLAEHQLATAWSTNGWRWCDKWADIRPNTQVYNRPYTLPTYPVRDAASRWTNVGLYQMGGKVDFDFYFYDSDGSAKIQLYSYNAGQNGRLATAAWSGWPWCFGSGEVEFNKGYWFNPPETTCNYSQGWFSLESVALHELGHLVGLDHSGDSNAIMYATIPYCQWKYLNGDDEAGIISIYGRRG